MKNINIRGMNRRIVKNNGFQSETAYVNPQQELRVSGGEDSTNMGPSNAEIIR